MRGLRLHFSFASMTACMQVLRMPEVTKQLDIAVFGRISIDVRLHLKVGLTFCGFLSLQALMASSVRPMASKSFTKVAKNSFAESGRCRRP